MALVSHSNTAGWLRNIRGASGRIAEAIIEDQKVSKVDYSISIEVPPTRSGSSLAEVVREDKEISKVNHAIFCDVGHRAADQVRLDALWLAQSHRQEPATRGSLNRSPMNIKLNGTPLS